MVTRTRAREHAILAHTADVGLTAAAGNLPGCFEEAALALRDVQADLQPSTAHLAARPVRLRAPDLAALAYAWLNELIGLADASHAAVAGARVARVDHVAGRAEWEIVGSVRLAPFGGISARPRLDVKSATLHRLTVEPEGDRWRLTAYLDV